jgi:hypothetical protein
MKKCTRWPEKWGLVGGPGYAAFSDFFPCFLTPSATPPTPMSAIETVLKQAELIAGGDDSREVGLTVRPMEMSVAYLAPVEWLTTKSGGKLPKQTSLYPNENDKRLVGKIEKLFLL